MRVGQRVVRGLPDVAREYTYDVKCLKKAAIEAHLIEAPLPLEHWYSTC
jgi:hypothetical protein